MEVFPLDLRKLHVSSENGFLVDDPLKTLPEYFESWNKLAKSMPELVGNKNMREAVQQMPTLDHSRLSGYRQHRLAHLQLAIIASGYIWQDGDAGVPMMLPECIAVPWCAVSKYLGLQPVLSHASLVLANWRCDKNTGEFHCLYELPGGQEADWFVGVTAQMEMDLAEGMQHMLSSLMFAEHHELTELVTGLEGIAKTIYKMKASLATMHDRLSAETFYNVLRPFLTGWGGEGSPLPDGIIYEGVSNKPIKMIGGSAAQSSTLQSVDAALGIVHSSDKQAFLHNMRNYMPPAHRQFIETIAANSQVRKVVQSSKLDKLTSAYDRCVSAIADFRSYHIQLVTKYIIVMAGKANRNKEYEALAKKGTGGSSILPFLKSLRSTTRDCLVLEDKSTRTDDD